MVTRAFKTAAPVASTTSSDIPVWACSIWINVEPHFVGGVLANAGPTLITAANAALAKPETRRTIARSPTGQFRVNMVPSER